MTKANEAQRREAEARRLGLDAVFEMSEAVPTDLVQEVVRDYRSGPTQPSSMMAAPKADPKPTQASEIPIGPRPKSEMELVDRMVERFAGGPNKLR